MLLLRSRDRVVLITDAMQAAGMPDGRYTLCGVTMQNGVVPNRLRRAVAVAGCRGQEYGGVRGRHRRRRYPYGLCCTLPGCWALTVSLDLAGQTRQYYCAGRGFTPQRIWIPGPGSPL